MGMSKFLTVAVIVYTYLLVCSASQFGQSAATSVRPMARGQPSTDTASSPRTSTANKTGRSNAEEGETEYQHDSEVSGVQSNSTSVGRTGPPADSRGMDAAHYSIDRALNYALQAANSSILELNKQFVPPEKFARYLEQLVENSTVVFRESVADCSAVYNLSSKAAAGVANPSVLRVCEKELTGRIYARMLPLYKRQVFLLKQELTLAFNKKVTEDLPVSIYILEDLQETMQDALRNFTQCAARLTPRGAPASRWNADFEVYELSQVMVEYIEGREHLYRAMGVLPRYGGSSGASPNALRVGNIALELPPTELSVHVLASHPLGRDYRQDSLGVRSSDKLSFSEDADQDAPKPVPAADLRAAWKRRVDQLETSARTGPLPGRISSALRRVGINLPSQLQRDRQRSEFAREMMMLPLSLKNPDISVASGGTQTGQKSSTRKARGRGKARTDTGDVAGQDKEGGLYDTPLQRRLQRGPERFVRWDLSPLREAKRDVEALTAGQSIGAAVLESVRTGTGVQEVTRRLADQLLNLVPPLGKSYYATPEVDYGPEYSPGIGNASRK